MEHPLRTKTGTYAKPRGTADVRNSFVPPPPPFGPPRPPPAPGSFGIGDMRGEGPLASDFTQDQKSRRLRHLWYVFAVQTNPYLALARGRSNTGFPTAEEMGITRRIFGVGMRSSALTASRDHVRSSHATAVA